MADFEAYLGQEPYIFISYAHKDRDLVFPVLERLRANGYRFWYDGGIEVGSDWSNSITERIENCSCFLAFLSKNYNDSNNCHNEITHALDCMEKGRLQLFLQLEEQALTGGLSMRTNHIQGIPMFEKDRRGKTIPLSEEKLYEKLFAVQGLAYCKEDNDAELDTYDGTSYQGKSHGKGRYMYASGAAYDGEWKFGKYYGTGTFTTPDGYSYVGEWRDGKKHGKGVETLQKASAMRGALSTTFARVRVFAFSRAAKSTPAHG